MPYAMGVHSGTSMDAISVAVVEIDDGDGTDDVELVASREYPYGDDARAALLEFVASDRVTLEEVSRLNVVVSEEFAAAARRFVDETGLSFDEMDVIGTYGQTVRHFPTGDPPSTLQLGEEAIVAERTGVDTVADFFVRDLAAGGAGAPLIMQFDRAAYASPDEHRLVLNVGGIANGTSLPADPDLEDVRAFDVGPGNMLIDATVREQTDGAADFDEDGERARRGEVSERLLEALMEHPFVRRKPPKSSGRDDFGERRLAEMMELAEDHDVEGDDLVATFTAFTAEAIAYNVERFVDGPVDRTIVFGGGSQNPEIVTGIRDRLEGAVVTADEMGYSHESREVMGVAYLGYRAKRGTQTNVPAATGSHPVPGGAMARGSIEREP